MENKTLFSSDAIFWLKSDQHVDSRRIFFCLFHPQNNTDGFTTIWNILKLSLISWMDWSSWHYGMKDLIFFSIFSTRLQKKIMKNSNQKFLFWCSSSYKTWKKIIVFNFPLTKITCNMAFVKQFYVLLEKLKISQPGWIEKTISDVMAEYKSVHLCFSISYKKLRVDKLSLVKMFS